MDDQKIIFSGVIKYDPTIDQSNTILNNTAESITYEIKEENITAQLTKAVTGEYIKFVKWCATQTIAETPRNCPFSDSWLSGDGYSNFVWTIKEMPKVEVFNNGPLEPGPYGRFQYLNFKVLGGKANLSYTYTDSYSWFNKEPVTEENSDVVFSSEYSNCQASEDDPNVFNDKYYNTSNNCEIKIKDDKVELYINDENISTMIKESSESS